MRQPEWLSFWFGAGLSAWVIGVATFVARAVQEQKRRARVERIMAGRRAPQG